METITTFLQSLDWMQFAGPSFFLTVFANIVLAIVHASHKDEN